VECTSYVKKRSNRMPQNGKYVVAPAPIAGVFCERTGSARSAEGRLTFSDRVRLTFRPVAAYAF
jgi:hypothetical protein